MTKIHSLLLLLSLFGVLAPPTTTAWVVPSIRTIAISTTTPNNHDNLSLSAAEDDYDAWLEQLDPAVFDEDVPRGGFKAHDYERDWKADRSNVDEEQVDRLLAERTEARKRGQFELADEIRDELLRAHGVGVRDKERLWRSGCSESGSGMKWGRHTYNNNNRNDEQQQRPKKRQPQNNFGPNGHDYSMAPDAGPIDSPLSLPQIHELLAERLQFKLNRNFRAADEVQDELYNNNVVVHDGKKQWRADGQGFGGPERGMKPGIEPGSRQDAGKGYYTMSKYSPPLVLDNEGLDEVAAREAAEDLKARVQDLVDERLDARINRAFSVADDIRDELKNYYNVFVDDRRREWSVNGIFDSPPTMSPYSLPIASLKSDLDQDNFDEQDVQLRIQTLVEERFHCKMERDYDTADRIREDLKDIYNVEVDDRNRVWSIGGQFDPPPEPYQKLPSSSPLVGIDEERVNEMLLEREQARKQRAFAIADNILYTLNQDYGISVFDDLRAWGVGVEDPRSQQSQQAPSRDLGKYVQRGAGELTEQERNEIEDLINKRSMFKSQRAFGKADRIRDQLQEQYGVRIDDRNREWHLVTNAYAYEPSAHQLDEDAIHFIREQVNERAQAKMDRDFERADAIRDSLMDQFGVSIDDRLKVWSVVVDPNNRLSSPFPEFATPEDIDDYDTEQETVKETSEGDYNEYYVEEEEEEESSDEAQAEGEENEGVDLESLKVVDLKELLKAEGLPVSGRKAELIERLREHKA